MEIKGLNELLIKRYSDISTYKKGEKYLKKGNIISLEQHGHTLCATIEGDNKIIFETKIMFDNGGILDTACTCEGANWCEHIVAALLGVVHHPDTIKHHLDLKELLQTKDAQDLKEIILKIADNNTDMEHLFVKYLSEVDRYNSSVISRNGSGSIGSNSAILKDNKTDREGKITVIDPAQFTKKVRYIIKKYEGRQNTDDAILELSGIVDEALEYVSNRDGKSALTIMESIINSYVEQWMQLDGSLGDTSLFFEDLDMALAKSLLTIDMTREEKRKYIKIIEQWQQKLNSDGVENAFVLSISSLVQGWDDPVLRLILIGEKVSMSVWGKNIPEYASLLTAIRLEILDIQQRYEEYLNLALHEECYFDYLMMLIKVNRPKDVLKNAQTMLIYNYQALTLADEMRRNGYLNEAVKIAEQGLTLEGESRAKLALWISERYEALGEREKSLEAIIIAFKEEPSLNEFLRIREIADKAEWLDIRNNLLAEIGTITFNKTTFNLSDIIDIFLHEGLINKAIKVVDKEREHYKEVLKVLDAAIKEKPEWVIKSACARAEEILEQANVKQYNKAATFLKKAQIAYNQTKMANLWSDYKQDLLKKHAQKPKLTALLEKL
ncbi:MAG: SWIM zinc finger family protein [Desulfamplus sp.]|nr:SWIM zinc finger family protein [Desulfamplus sp.]